MKIKSSYQAVEIVEGFCAGEGSSDEDKIEAMQFLIDCGDAYRLQGFYGRTANSLIQQGLCTARAA